MATKIDFKNVIIANRATDVVKPTKPIGIKTPIHRGSRFGLFDMNTDVLEQIKDNFRNLLLTNHNERLINTSIGANIRPLFFENGGAINNDFAGQVATNIKTAVSEYMSYIQLDSMEILFHENDERVPNNYINVQIKFLVPGLIKDGSVSTIDLFLKA